MTAIAADVKDAEEKEQEEAVTAAQDREAREAFEQRCHSIHGFSLLKFCSVLYKSCPMEKLLLIVVSHVASSTRREDNSCIYTLLAFQRTQDGKWLAVKQSSEDVVLAEGFCPCRVRLNRIQQLKDGQTALPRQAPQSEVVALHLEPSLLSKPKKRKLEDIKEEPSASDGSSDDDNDDLNWRAKADWQDIYKRICKTPELCAVLLVFAKDSFLQYDISTRTTWISEKDLTTEVNEQ